MEPPRPPGEKRYGCAYHPQVPAEARCVGCSRLLCNMCRFIVGDRNYCRTCASAVTGYDYSWQPPPRGTLTLPALPVREPSFPDAPWGVGEAVVIFLIAFVAANMFSVFMYTALRSFYGSSVTAIVLLLFISSCILYTVLLGGTFFSVKVRHGSPVSAIGLKLGGTGKSLSWGLGLGIPLFLGALGLGYVSQKIFSPTPTDSVNKTLSNLASGGVTVPMIVLLFFTLIVLAPVCEEIFFRGYLYPALRNRLDEQPAMIINAVIFAAVHMQLAGFLPRALLGYGLCYMFEKSRNLSGSIVGHALYNGLLLIIFGFLIK